jgi:putative OPT family oligopeptide transporter
VQDASQRFVSFGKSTIEILQERVEYAGGMLIATPSASPALIGVGYIVGMRVSSVLFSGAVMGWLLLVPLAYFLNPSLSAGLSGEDSLIGLATTIWLRQVRPLAVGTMIVAAFYTLYNLRKSLVAGIGKALSDLKVSGAADTSDRTEIDIDFKKVLVGIGVMAIATFFLYRYFSGEFLGAALLTVVMVVLGFLFAAVAGYLVGLIGSSNNPISGLTLSALLISAVLMVFIGLTDVHGVAAVLGVAGVVCCAAGIAGDMMQDLKVGHILGGTPWKMQVGEVIGVVAAAMVLAFPLMALHKVYVIGSAELPAPQAGLMALMAQGIVGGEMAWPLVIVGMFLAIGLILIKSPSPMLIAVGMYLPFESTAAIFVGGVIKALLERRLEKKQASGEEKVRAENMGTLLSSGFIAGESLMAVALAFLVLGQDLHGTTTGVVSTLTWLPSVLRNGLVSASGAMGPNAWLALVIYPVLLYLLVWLPIRKMRGSGLPATKVE